jgi:hypothetical protein
MKELTPRQKARELYEWFYLSDERGDMTHTMSKDAAKLFANKLVNELIKSQPKLVNAAGYGNAMFANPMLEYWNQVKLELENIIF